MRKILLTVFTLTVLTACNGSNEEKARERMIERELNLPPKPNEKLDNSIIGGVDSNGNGIRDKHERGNAFALYPDRKKIAVTNALSRIYREKFLNVDNPKKLTELQFERRYLGICMIETLTDDEKYMFRKRLAYNNLEEEFYQKHKMALNMNRNGAITYANELAKCEAFLSTIE